MNTTVALGHRSFGRLVYPAIVRLRGEGSVFAALDELREVEHLPREALARRQAARLAELLRYARSASPYWSKRIPAAATAAGADPLAVLADIEPLSKRALQEHADELRARPQPPRVARKITGGSTGEAVTVYKDAEAVARERAASWLGYGWFGIVPGDRGARFWGSPYTLARRLRFAAADFAMHRIRFSAFAFDEADLERYWRRCLRFRPAYFYGYASMLEEFARFVQRRGHDGAALGLKAIITTSEVLSGPQRELLSTTFGTRVQDEYGCGEVGPIAYECPQGGRHIMTENLHVELLRSDGTPAGPGEAGEVVVTDLNNRAMPLIRYALSDFAAWGEPCSCGRGFPVFDRVWGRQYDFVQMPDGRRYHGEFFMYFFEDLRAGGLDVKKFQVVQDEADHLEIRVVVPPELDAAADDRIARDLRERLPARITVRRVPRIDRLPSGKTRVIVNAWLAARNHGAPEG